LDTYCENCAPVRKCGENHQLHSHRPVLSLFPSGGSDLKGVICGNPTLWRYRPVFSILSFGGQRIVDEHHCITDEAVQIVNTAIERGIRYFDTAWAYSNGQAEERLESFENIILPVKMQNMRWKLVNGITLQRGSGGACKRGFRLLQ